MRDTKENMAKLETVIQGLDKLAIIIAQMDPDAVGSALLLQKITQAKFGKTTRIFYCGGLEHPQNQVIFNLYNLHDGLEPIAKYEGWPIALVDSSRAKDGRLGSVEINPQNIRIVIDHHRDRDVKENGDNFILIEEVGAATTLVAEILFEMKMELEDGCPEATIGAVGIFTDTNTTIAATKRDIQMFGKLYQKADLPHYRTIVNYDIPLEYFDYLTKALKEKRICDGKLVAGLGLIKSGEEGAMVFVADRLIRMKGVTLSIVWGIAEDEGRKYIRATARSSDITQDLNDYLRKLFGENSGAKFGPDHKGAGGARVPIPNLMISPNGSINTLSGIKEGIEYVVFRKEPQTEKQISI